MGGRIQVRERVRKRTRVLDPLPLRRRTQPKEHAMTALNDIGLAYQRAWAAWAALWLPCAALTARGWLR
jgi:hypothetical protein